MMCEYKHRRSTAPGPIASDRAFERSASSARKDERSHPAMAAAAAIAGHFVDVRELQKGEVA